MAKMGMTLEIELGVTGGEEDGVDNSDVDSSRLYNTARGRGLLIRRAFKSEPPFYGSGSFWQRAWRI